MIQNAWIEGWNMVRDGKERFPGIEGIEGATLNIAAPMFFDRSSGGPLIGIDKTSVQVPLNSWIEKNIGLKYPG